MSEYSYPSRDSSRSRSRAHNHGGTQFYAASTTSFDSVQQQGLGGTPYTTTSPRMAPSSVPSPRIDTNVGSYHPPRTTHVKHDSATSYISSIDGRSSYSTSTTPSSYIPSPHTPYSPSPLNPSRDPAPPTMDRANTKPQGVTRQADGSYYVDRSDDDRSERRARKEQEKEMKVRRAKSHSDMGSTYSSDAGSTYSTHVPPLPALPSQYAGSMHRGAGGSISSSNFGAPETPRAQAFSSLEALDPTALSHHKKSTRSRREARDDESRYGGSDAGSTRSHQSKRAKSVASSRRAPSVAGSAHAPSMAGFQYALQPYVAPTLTAGQTPPPPPGSNYSYDASPTPASVYQAQAVHAQNQVMHAQNQVVKAQQAVRSAGSTYQLAYSQQYDVKRVPGQPNNVYHIGTNVNVFVNSAEDLSKVGKELKGLKNLKDSKGAGSLFKTVLLGKRRSLEH